MLTKLILASVVASFAACVPCDPEVTQHGLAPRPQYDIQIDACITKHSCLPLCRSIFQLDSSDDIDSCKIELVDAANAHVVIRYYNNACNSSDDSDVIVGGDGGYYDDGSTDDGSTDDGSTDDGSTDDGGDGSTSGGGDSGDGGGDSGGGDSGGGDGGYRVQSHEAVKSLTTPNPRQ